MRGLKINYMGRRKQQQLTEFATTRPNWPSWPIRSKLQKYKLQKCKLQKVRIQNCRSKELQITEAQNYKLQEYRKCQVKDVPKGPSGT